MRITPIVTAAAAVAAVSVGFAAQAQTYNQPMTVAPVERIYVEPANQPSGTIHGGYVTYDDAQLLSDAIGALSSDRRVDGSILTIVAKNGELIVNGSTLDAAQATRIETKLRQLAGVTRVTAWFDSAGA